MTIGQSLDSLTLFTVGPRGVSGDPVAEFRRLVEWSDRYGFDGMLIYTANDAFLEPWMAAQILAEATRRLSPLVAVNPVYMHPFTVAKMIASFASAYQRRISLNMVTGAALNQLAGLGDQLSHADRYDRLAEFALLVHRLTVSTKPVTMAGRYYNVTDLQLMPGVPTGMRPHFFFAGHSEGALRAALAVEGILIRMLPEVVDGPQPKAIHFGVITRPKREAAWVVAHERFPKDAYGTAVLSLSMANTDSTWKRRMHQQSELARTDAMPGYWPEPFRGAQADCPYFIGSYADFAGLIRRLAGGGTNLAVLEIPPYEEEFFHTAAALSRQLAVL